MLHLRKMHAWQYLDTCLTAACVAQYHQLSSRLKEKLCPAVEPDDLSDMRQQTACLRGRERGGMRHSSNGGRREGGGPKRGRRGDVKSKVRRAQRRLTRTDAERNTQQWKLERELSSRSLTDPSLTPICAPVEPLGSAERASWGGCKDKRYAHHRPPLLPFVLLPVVVSSTSFTRRLPVQLVWRMELLMGRCSDVSGEALCSLVCRSQGVRVIQRDRRDEG